MFSFFFAAKFVANCPTGFCRTNRIYIWSPSVCFKNAHHAPLLFSDRTIKSSIGRFQAHDLQVLRKLLIRISVLLQKIPPFWKGGQQWQVRRQQNSRNVELIKFLPSSNSRPVTLFMNTDGDCRSVFARIHISLCADKTPTTHY